MTDISDTPKASIAEKPRKRGCLFLFTRGLKWLGILLLVLVVAGVIFQLVATEIDKRNFPLQGQLVNVDGHLMHIHCMGEGSPTVILEAGGISYSSEWYWVQQQLSPTNRVCAYDRAGNGWSEPSPAPREAIEVVHELHALLEEAEVSLPYVLAGHSYGGVINRIYAHEYPDEVLGIVLVDTAFVLPATFQTQDDFDQWKRENDILQVFLWAMVRTGVYRLLIGGDIHGYGYPEAIAAELVALRSTNQAFDTYYAEGILARRQLTEQAKAAEHLGDLPLIVLWATEGPTLSASDRARFATLQQAVAEYSSNSATRYVEGSDHGSIIGNEQYAQQVTDAVLDVIESTRAGEPLS